MKQTEHDKLLEQTKNKLTELIINEVEQLESNKIKYEKLMAKLNKNLSDCTTQEKLDNMESLLELHDYNYKIVVSECRLTKLSASLQLLKLSNTEEDKAKAFELLIKALE